jgi:hypothetical protein
MKHFEKVKPEFIAYQKYWNCNHDQLAKSSFLNGFFEGVEYVKTNKMQRQSIIVFIQGERIETYGNLKKCCEAENLKYHTLARLKFPIRINDVVIHKTLFK